MKLLSTFFSEDQMREARVFKKQDTYMVEVMDNHNHKESRYEFEREMDAEDFAEDWVL